MYFSLYTLILDLSTIKMKMLLEKHKQYLSFEVVEDEDGIILSLGKYYMQSSMKFFL